MTYRAIVLGLSGLVALFALSLPAGGQEATVEKERGSLSTSGVGEVMARPSSLIMVTSVSGQAELAADALKKFENNKQQALKALKNLGVENLTVEETGMSMQLAFDQQKWNMLRRGGNVEDMKGDVVAREQLQIVVRDTDTMDREKLLQTMVALIDSVQDAGLSIGSTNMLNPYSGYVPFSPIFAFRLDDAESLYAEARTRAVENARQGAVALAKETGVELGGLISVSEQQMPYQPPSSPYNNNNVFQSMRSTGASGESASGMLSDVMGEVPLRVRVNLSYRIASP